MGSQPSTQPEPHNRHSDNHKHITNGFFNALGEAARFGNIPLSITLKPAQFFRKRLSEEDSVHTRCVSSGSARLSCEAAQPQHQFLSNAARGIQDGRPAWRFCWAACSVTGSQPGHQEQRLDTEFTVTVCCGRLSRGV